MLTIVSVVHCVTLGFVRKLILGTNMATSSLSRGGRKRKSQQTEESGNKSMKIVLDGPVKDVDQTKSKYFVASKSDKSPGGKKLNFSFYDIPCDELAEALLGQTLVRMHDGKRLAGKIVETEAYMGPIDKAAHSYNGKKTDKNAAMFMAPGTAYVYNIYGMYCCMNISAQGDGAAVLIRSLEPVDNLELMDKLRTKGKAGASLLKKNGVGLCNGPSKLCQSLSINKNDVNKTDLCSSDDIWLEKGDLVSNDSIVKCKRININYAEDWVDKPLRFYILGSAFVSVRDKLVEKDMKAQ